MTFDGVIFDFDGVLIESEFVSGEHIAATLTQLGHRVSTAHALDHFSGLSGTALLAAIEATIGAPVPEGFHPARRAEDVRVLAEGIDAIDGAIAFVEALSTDLPRAIASSSSTHWIATHLAHIGLTAAFGPHVYSGREHVSHGKPAPDIYIYAATAIGIDIARALIIEDSIVGVTGAVASGATVVGLAAGRHCRDGHDARLRALGAHHVVHSFDEIAALMA